MSPEQCEGRGAIDHRTDVYALGIVLYEMLTGRTPFVGEGYGEILVQHLTQPPTPPSTFRGLSPHVEAVVLKALEKRADMRFPTMEEFMRAMADPVGYIEATGGIAGFTQRRLNPSNAPVPPISRLTPSPFIQMTPAPGMLSPTPMHAKPTTLGGAAGEVQGGSGRRIGLIAAVILLLVGGGTAAYLATRKSTTDASAASGSGSNDGSQVAMGSDGSAGSAGLPDIGSGSAAGSGTTPETGSGSGSLTGSGTETGSGSGSGSVVTAGSGSDAGSARVPERKVIKLEVATSPSGAIVILDGKRLGLAPGPFEVTRVEGKRGKLEIKYPGYRSIEQKISLDQGFSGRFTLKKKGGGSNNNDGKGSGDNTHDGGGDNLLKPDDL
jgi:serine/threonine-protein kinase